MSSKTDSKYENPIDNIFYRLSEYIMPTLYKLNITPNHITLFGNIFGIIAAYSLYKNKLTYFSISLLLSHFMDSLDGQYARNYNMVSKYGDFLDTASDFFKISLLLLVVIIKYDFKKIFKYNTLLLILTLVSLLLTLFHNGCMERIKYTYQNTDQDDNKSYFLNHADSLSCPIKEKQTIKKFISIIKYFTNSSSIIFVIILLYSSRKFRK